VTFPSPAGLWRHRDFRQLWAAETVSQVGTQITVLALPVLAVTILHATPLEMGVLTALETAAFLVIGLPAGAWVDRWRRKWVLVVSDVVRAVALTSLPAAWLLDVLTLPQLFLVAAATGTATVFFDVAYQSYLPTLVARDQIVDGNSKLETSRAVAQVAGPGITGVLLRVLGAPLLIALDALSFLVSALFIGRIRHVDSTPDRATRRKLRAEIAEGLAFVVRHPLLRRMVACTSIFNLFSSMTMALLVLFVLRTLELSESTLGFVFSAGAVGGLLGAATAAWFVRRVGGVRRPPSARGRRRPGGAARVWLVRGQLGSRRVQRHPGQLPAAALPADAARPDECLGPVHRVRHHAGGRPARRRPRRLAGGRAGALGGRRRRFRGVPARRPEPAHGDGRPARRVGRGQGPRPRRRPRPTRVIGGAPG
jgi:MFS family permease